MLLYIDASVLKVIKEKKRGLCHDLHIFGEQGWCSGESIRLPPMWPGFNSWHRRHMWVKFVVGSFPCSKRFFCGHSGFPLSSKTNISKFQFHQESGRRRTTMWLCCYLQIVIYFLYLFKKFWRLSMGMPIGERAK